MPAEPETRAGAAEPPAHPGLTGLLLDFAPLLIFFVASKVGGVIAGTIAFMVAISVALVVSKWRLGRISPMLWLSAVLVLLFGSLTVYLGDPRFIQIKPTIIYALFALLLLGGLVRGKPLLRYLLQHAYQGLSETGWRKLSRNWGLFFGAMALANEVARAALSFDDWLLLKVWGMTLLSLIFAFANVPMLRRHGLSFEPGGKAETIAELEPPQG